MRILNAAWKAVRAISILVFVFQPPANGQQVVQNSRLDRLLSSDPAVRGAAKSELLEHPDQALLPALLKALSGSQGTNRDGLLEVLAKYDDPSKLPVFLPLLKPFHSDNASFQIGQQLAHLGAPAAQAILAGCEGAGEGYPEWAAGGLKTMDTVGLASFIEALLRDDEARRGTGRA